VRTHNSFTFWAKPIDYNHAVMSAGRWDTHLEAAQAAATWLVMMANDSPQQHTVSVIQIEELDLIEADQ
jgi:hypothetical protein